MSKIWSKILVQFLSTKLDKEKILFFALPVIVLGIFSIHLMTFAGDSIDFTYKNMKNMVYGAYFTGCADNTQATGDTGKLRVCYLFASEHRKRIFPFDIDVPAMEIMHAERYGK